MPKRQQLCHQLYAGWPALRTQSCAGFTQRALPHEPWFTPLVLRVIISHVPIVREPKADHKTPPCTAVCRRWPPQQRPRCKYCRFLSHHARCSSTWSGDRGGVPRQTWHHGARGGLFSRRLVPASCRHTSLATFEPNTCSQTATTMFTLRG